MRKYQVLWSPSAEEQLASLWLKAPNRDVFRLAADKLDELLTTAPRELGESRDANDRIFISKSLAILFEVIDADMTVVVLAAWESRGRDDS